MLSRAFWLFLLGVVATASLSSHPHVWVDARVEVTMVSGVVQGLQVDLTFDDVFSSLVLQDAAPGATTLTPKDVETIRTTYFKDLRSFSYFVTLVQGNKLQKVPTPERFVASLEKGNRLRYRFFLPLQIAVSETMPLSIWVLDESFYVDVQPTLKDAVRLLASGKGKARYEWLEAGKPTPSTAVPEVFQFRVSWSP